MPATFEGLSFLERKDYEGRKFIETWIYLILLTLFVKRRKVALRVFR